VIICPCSRAHSPRITVRQLVHHHSPPLAYSLLLGADRLVIPMCPTAHYIEHDLLEELRTTGVISAKSRAMWSKWLVDMALLAWEKTDFTMPVPRTVA
jgi:hypothetical protein